MPPRRTPALHKDPYAVRSLDYDDQSTLWDSTQLPIVMRPATTGPVPMRQIGHVLYKDIKDVVQRERAKLRAARTTRRAQRQGTSASDSAESDDSDLDVDFDDDEEITVFICGHIAGSLQQAHGLDWAPLYFVKDGIDPSGEVDHWIKIKCNLVHHEIHGVELNEWRWTGQRGVCARIHQQKTTASRLWKVHLMRIWRHDVPQSAMIAILNARQHGGRPGAANTNARAPGSIAAATSNTLRPRADVLRAAQEAQANVTQLGSGLDDPAAAGLWARFNNGQDTINFSNDRAVANLRTAYTAAKKTTSPPVRVLQEAAEQRVNWGGLITSTPAFVSWQTAQRAGGNSWSLEMNVPGPNGTSYIVYQDDDRHGPRHVRVRSDTVQHQGSDNTLSQLEIDAVRADPAARRWIDAIKDLD